jgi:hypothetical protein
MKKTPESTDYETDDEALREAAFRDGPRKAGKWKLRPCVPGTISIIRSNMLEKRDEAWFVAAYGYVHTTPIDEILEVEIDPIAFNKAVRRWQLNAFTSKEEEAEFAEMVKKAYDKVSASETRAQHASTGSTESGK